jgi:hypothetical protein
LLLRSQGNSGRELSFTTAKPTAVIKGLPLKRAALVAGLDTTYGFTLPTRGSQRDATTRCLFRRVKIIGTNPRVFEIKHADVVRRMPV